MIVPWFVLLVSAVNKTQPFLQPYYIDTTVILYALVCGIAHVLQNDEDWRAKLEATNSEDKLMTFQCLEAAVALPSAFVSIYLLFDLIIPMWVFYTCLILGVFGDQFVKWRWKKQMRQLSLG
jgi:hypothetical protein